MKDDLGRERRREGRFERLGTRQPRCRYCPESNPFALQGIYPDIACHECAAQQAGRKTTEGHHVGGRHNSSVIVDMQANDHRVKSDMQRDWPERTLRNPDGSPLLAAAAKIRDLLDQLRLIIDRAIEHIPTFLETLDERLRAKLGDRWWEELGLEGAK